jgi:hypothetical protein
MMSDACDGDVLDEFDWMMDFYRRDEGTMDSLRKGRDEIERLRGRVAELEGSTRHLQDFVDFCGEGVKLWNLSPVIRRNLDFLVKHGGAHSNRIKLAALDPVPDETKRQRDAAEQRLRDVVRLAAACDRNEDGPYPEEVMTAAGRERCEKCQGTGSVSEFKSGAVQGYVSRNCDCCINGWREKT